MKEVLLTILARCSCMRTSSTDWGGSADDCESAAGLDDCVSGAALDGCEPGAASDDCEPRAALGGWPSGTSTPPAAGSLTLSLPKARRTAVAGAESSFAARSPATMEGAWAMGRVPNRNTKSAASEDDVAAMWISVSATTVREDVLTSLRQHAGWGGES